MVEAQFDEMYCSILLLDADGRNLRHGAAPRLPEAYYEGDRWRGHRGGSGLVRNGRVLPPPACYVEDILVDPLWANYKHFAIPHGLRACWSTPIIDLNGHVLGTFAIYYLQPGAAHRAAHAAHRPRYVHGGDLPRASQADAGPTR